VLKEELEVCQKDGVFEEFMPVKSTIEEKIGGKVEDDSKDKKSWMSSVQLWSHSEEDDTEKPQNRSSQKVFFLERTIFFNGTPQPFYIY
jgi:hypothetical protein